MTKIVEDGINLEISGADLAAQAAERATWHRRSAESVAAEIERIPARSEPEQPTDWRREVRRNDLARRLALHEEHARFLDFVGQHLNREQVYRVKLHELSQLEIAPKALYL